VICEQDLTGKEMLFTPMAYEAQCPGCGKVPGVGTTLQPQMVTVLHRIDEVHCPACDFEFSVEGYWTISLEQDNGNMIAAPYTLLRELGIPDN